MLDCYRPPAATRCHRRSASRHPPRPASRHTVPRLPARSARTARSLRIAASAYRPGMCRTRRVLRRPTASCGAFRHPVSSLPPFSPNCPYSALHGVLRRHFRHAPAYPSYRLSPSADSPLYPCDTAASRASRRQAAVSVSRPISLNQFLTDIRTAAGTPACPARTGQRCRRTRGAPPYP